MRGDGGSAGARGRRGSAVCLDHHRVFETVQRKTGRRSSKMLAVQGLEYICFLFWF